MRSRSDSRKRKAEQDQQEQHGQHGQHVQQVAEAHNQPQQDTRGGWNDAGRGRRKKVQ